MKKTKLIIFSFVLVLVAQISIGQNLQKLDYKPLDKEYIELREKLKEIAQTDPEKSIQLCLKGLKKFNDKSTRFYLIFWELSFHYAELEQYDKCLGILKRGQDEGMFYYLSNRRSYPPYLSELQKLDGYEAFAKKDQELRSEANKNSSTEYMVQLPENYDENETYPLMIIMHGGIGDIPGLQYYYQSKKLKTDFIVTYTHGSNLIGLGSRAYSRDKWRDNIKSIYKNLTTNYVVDTSKVILGGPSAGAYRSLILGLNNDIPAKGLLLSFAINPRNWDSTIYVNSAKRGLKAALLCGENDWAIEQQKKLGHWFDKYGIKNRFVVFPEEGHNFPKNWVYYLETSIDYLFKEED